MPPRFRRAATITALFCFAGSNAQAQNSAVNPEGLIENQHDITGPGSLIELLLPQISAGRQHTQDRFGLSFAGTYFVSAQTSSNAEDETIAGQAGLAFRWDHSDVIRGELTSLVGYLEHRHSISGPNGADFNASVGALSSPHAFSGDFTCIRQLYLRQSLSGGDVVVGLGRFSLRGLFSQSRITTDKARGFQSSALSRAPSTPWPSDSVGAYGRWQPRDRHWAVSGGVFDAMPEQGSGDLRFEAPYAFASFHWHSTPWQMDSGSPPPKHQLQWTVYHQPSTDIGTEGFGMLGVYDLRLGPAAELGLRYGLADRSLGSIRQNAAAGIIFSSPFDRPNDAVGFGIAWTQASSTPRSESSVEMFYRAQLARGIEISPNIQFTETASDANTTVIGIRTSFFSEKAIALA